MEEQKSSPLAVPLRFIIELIAVAAIYFGLGKLGLSLAFLHPSASPIWPPTGFAFAALLLLGIRLWPAILIGAFLVNVTTKGGVETSIAIGIGNALEAVAGALLINKFAEGRDVFNRPQNVMKFAVLAAIGATMISPTIGVFSLALRDHAPWNSFGQIWTTWWLGDVMGALIFTAPIVLAFPRQKVEWQPGRFAEAALTVVGLALAAWAAYGTLLPSEIRPYVRGYLIIPALTWIAFRFRPATVACAMLVVTAVVIPFTLTGPNAPVVVPSNIASADTLAYQQTNLRLLVIQGFLGTLSVTMLCLSAAVSGKRLAMMKMAESESRFRSLANDSPSMVWESDADGNGLFVNKRFSDFTGLEAHQLLEPDASRLVHPEDLERVTQEYQGKLRVREPFAIDYRLMHKSGEYRWVHNTGTPRFLEDGEFLGYVGSCYDVTERKEHEENLLREAMLDPLCRLPNRVLFMDRLEHRMLKRARAGFHSFAVLYCDIDKFKSINDVHGHHVGDAVLIEVARRIQQNLRGGDTAARLSGDEFAVILEYLEADSEAEDVVKRLLIEISDPITVDLVTVRVTASIGIVVARDFHEDGAAVLKQADDAMYKAKAFGGNTYSFEDGDALGAKKPS